MATPYSDDLRARVARAVLDGRAQLRRHPSPPSRNLCWTG